MASPPDLLARLERRRQIECRLDPALALETFAQAEDFLGSRGLLTRTADGALPSLFAACHERPYAPGTRGFGSWPATRYPWFWELGRAAGVVDVAIHRGRRLLLTAATAALADPLCRAELAAREQAGDDPARLLRHLSDAGPSHVEDVKLELGWGARSLRAARAPLERFGALVSRSVTVAAGAGSHRHTSLLSRWDQVVPGSAAGGIDELIVAGVRAAVVAREAELRGWFSWPLPERLVDGLVDGGRLRRPAPGWVSLS